MRSVSVILVILILAASVIAIPTGYSRASKYSPPTGMIGFEKTILDTDASVGAKATPVETSQTKEGASTGKENTPEISPIAGKTPVDSSPVVSPECNKGTTTCGVGACKKTVQNCVNGIPQKCFSGSPLIEKCGNDIDDNCNGKIDEDCKVTCTPNWVYTQWGPCSSSGVQLRKVSDSNSCGTMVGAPTDVTQPCSSLCNSVMQSCSVGVGGCVRSGTQTRPCVNGVLGNLSACSAVAGTPVPEICGNGIDENCNGLVDDGCPSPCTPVSQPCAVGVGACVAFGNQTRSCVNGVLTALFGACSATPGTPVPEVCGNNIDDNCNGQNEEGCANLPDGSYCQTSSQCVSQNCVNGGCLSYPDCVNACTTTVQNCQSYSCGWFGQSTCQHCSPYQTTDQACVQSCVPTCTPVSSQCSVGVGRCANTGSQIQYCVAGALSAPSACSATPGTPIPEMCGNALDDDCDGQVDDGCPPPPCIQGSKACGLGACQKIIPNCVNGVAQPCTPGPVYPIQEICGNNIDDNCNGQIDEWCLNQNGQSCNSWSQCYSQSCSNGICTSHQDCINACTTTVQNCYSYSCGFAGWSTCQQCNPYQNTDPGCAMSCH